MAKLDDNNFSGWNVIHPFYAILRNCSKPVCCLKAKQTEKNLRLYGISVLGSSEKFEEWWNSKIPALNNKTPKESGVDDAYYVLHAIEHGIYI
jgi:hypothetical protein